MSSWRCLLCDALNLTLIVLLVAILAMRAMVDLMPLGMVAVPMISS